MDKISIVLSEPPREFEIIPEEIPVNVIYEDDTLIVVNKAHGMVVHPGYGNYTGTLINALTWHFSLPKNPKGNPRPGLVHRIDKETTGVLIVAKNRILADTRIPNPESLADAESLAPNPEPRMSNPESHICSQKQNSTKLRVRIPW